MTLDQPTPDAQQTEEQQEQPPNRLKQWFLGLGEFVKRSKDPEQDKPFWEFISRWGALVGLVAIALGVLSWLYIKLAPVQSQNSAPDVTPVTTIFPAQATADASFVEKRVIITITGLSENTNSLSFNFETGEESKELDDADLVISNCRETLTGGELFCTLSVVDLKEVFSPVANLRMVNPPEYSGLRPGTEGTLFQYQTFVLFAYDGYPVRVRIVDYRFSEVDQDGNAISAELVIDYVYQLDKLRDP